MGDSFFTELRRRNVLRVAFVYLVAAWLILQVADLIVPILGVPEWSSKLIFLLLIFVPFKYKTSTAQSLSVSNQRSQVKSD